MLSHWLELLTTLPLIKAELSECVVDRSAEVDGKAKRLKEERNKLEMISRELSGTVLTERVY